MIGRMRSGIGSLRKKDSPLEAQLKEATSRENWGVPNTTLQAIAQATQNMEDNDVIMAFLWKVLQEKKDKEWRRIVKALALIEMILKHGSERAIQDIRRDAWRIQQWKEFRYMEEGKDVGSGIRSKASSIIEMVTDEELLTEEKEKAENLKKKMSVSGVGGSAANVAPAEPGGSSAFKSPFDRDRRSWRRKKQPEESPQSSPASPGFGAAGRSLHPDGDTSQMVSQFMSVTNASRLVAKEHLERHNWDLHNAVMQYLASESSNQLPPSSAKPGWTERKSRVDSIVSIAKVSERVAEEYLEKANWNVETALDKVLEDNPSSAPAPKSAPSKPSPTKAAVQESSSSGSEESYSEEESEEEEAPQKGKGGDKGGWPQNGKGGAFGSWPDSGGGAWPGGGGGAAQNAPASNGWGSGGGWPNKGDFKGSKGSESFKGGAAFGKGGPQKGGDPFNSQASAPWGSSSGCPYNSYNSAPGGLPGKGGNPFGGGFGSQAPQRPPSGFGEKGGGGPSPFDSGGPGSKGGPKGGGFGGFEKGSFGGPGAPFQGGPSPGGFQGGKSSSTGWPDSSMKGAPPNSFGKGALGPAKGGDQFGSAPGWGPPSSGGFHSSPGGAPLGPSGFGGPPGGNPFGSQVGGKGPPSGGPFGSYGGKGW